MVRDPGRAGPSTGAGASAAAAVLPGHRPAFKQLRHGFGGCLGRFGAAHLGRVFKPAAHGLGLGAGVVGQRLGAVADALQGAGHHVHVAMTLGRLQPCQGELGDGGNLCTALLHKMVHLGEGIGQLPRGVAVLGGGGLGGGVHALALRVEGAAPREGAQASARETAFMVPYSCVRFETANPAF